VSNTLPATPRLAIAVAGEIDGGESRSAIARIVSAVETSALAVAASCE
jgi:hypothetical protein